jgi:CheY-like chemotaxis protein
MPSEPRSAAGAALPDNAETAARPHDTRVRILIVEDDYFVAIALEQILVDAGFAVVGIAITAEEALQLATRHQPALAVMDIRLAAPWRRHRGCAGVEISMRNRICICDRPRRQGYASTCKRRAASRLVD